MTENTYLYSALTDAFYPVALTGIYKSAGTWPDDGIEVTDDVFNEFSSSPPKGKMRTGGPDGLPAWVDIPPLTTEQLITQADQHKSALLRNAQAIISVWQSELQLGIISDGDKASLIAWIEYIKVVQEIDTSMVPDIIWPDRP